MMQSGKLVEFVKRWRELQAQTRALDFAKSKFAHDLRSEFPAGFTGEEQFTTWCATELGLGRSGQLELVIRAMSIDILSDEKTYKAIGGFNQIRKLSHVPASDRVACIQVAKNTGKRLSGVIRERGHVTAHDRPTYKLDAEALARFMNSRNYLLPPQIAAIVRQYISSAAPAVPSPRKTLKNAA